MFIKKLILFVTLTNQVIPFLFYFQTRSQQTKPDTKAGEVGFCDEENPSVSGHESRGLYGDMGRMGREDMGEWNLLGDNRRINKLDIPSSGKKTCNRSLHFNI